MRSQGEFQLNFQLERGKIPAGAPAGAGSYGSHGISDAVNKSKKCRANQLLANLALQKALNTGSQRDKRK